MPSRKAIARHHVRLNARRVVTSDVSAFGRWRDLTLPGATAWLRRCSSAATRGCVGCRLAVRVSAVTTFGPSDVPKNRCVVDPSSQLSCVPFSGPNDRAGSVLSDVKKRSGYPAGGDMHGQVFDDWNRYVRRGVIRFGKRTGNGTTSHRHGHGHPSVQLPPAGKLCHAAKRSAGKQFRTRQRSGLQRVDEATAETQHM